MRPEGNNTLELVTYARTLLYAEPAALVAAFWLLLNALGQTFTNSRQERAVSGAPDRLQVALAVVCAGVYAGMVVWYVELPTFFDHIEASVAAISFYAGAGHSLYPSADDLTQYALPYGPYLYLLTWLPMHVLGASTGVSKIASVLAALSSVVAVAWAGRAIRSGGVTAGLVCLWYLAFGAMSFWTRAEPLLLACVALPLVFLTRRPAIATIGIGVALGVAIGVKVTAGAYFLPILAIHQRRCGTRWLVTSLSIAAIAAVAPFLLIPGVDGGSYLHVLASTARHGIRWRGIATEVQWAGMVALPGLVLWRHSTGTPMMRDGLDLRAGAIALAVSAAVMVPVAAKYGAGAYHFLPFVPISIYLAMHVPQQANRSRGTLRAAIVAALALLAAVQQMYWIGAVRSRPFAEIEAEVQTLTRSGEGTMAVGYARDYQASMFRPVPVFAGNPYVLDAPSLMDHQISGLPFPDGAIRMLESCAIGTWLLPAGAPPFVVPNAYDATLMVFPPEFIGAFHRTYVLAGRHRYFDEWKCRADK
jgi:hypothetical protein